MAVVNGFELWDDEFERKHFSEEEITVGKLRAALISELIKSRNEERISQRGLERLSGVKQPQIANIERGINSPTVSMLIKLLLPLGKTLKIVPLEEGALSPWNEAEGRTEIFTRESQPA